MTKKTGVILIHRHNLKSNSSGYKAYLIDGAMEIFQLQRNGYLNINDDFFYSYANKECEVTYSTVHQNTLFVEELVIMEEGVFLKEKPHHAKKQFTDHGLTNSKLIDTDYYSLSIVTNQANAFDAEPKRLYGRLQVNGISICFRISIQALELFLDNRITVLELLRLRADELFYQEKAADGGLASFVFPSRMLAFFSDFEFTNQYFETLKIPSLSKDQILNEMKSLTKFGVIETLKDFNS
jgi:hypothetical protein